MEGKDKVVRTGIGIIAFNSTGDKFLIGKRIKENLFGLPGGRLEYFESFEECARRELEEETGLNLDIKRFRTITCFNTINKEANYHWVAVYVRVDLNREEEEQIINTEPDKCESWEWITIEDLLTNLRGKLFYSTETFIELYKIKSMDDLKSI